MIQEDGEVSLRSSSQQPLGIYIMRSAPAANRTRHERPVTYSGILQCISGKCFDVFCHFQTHVVNRDD